MCAAQCMLFDSFRMQCLFCILQCRSFRNYNNIRRCYKFLNVLYHFAANVIVNWKLYSTWTWLLHIQEWFVVLNKVGAYVNFNSIIVVALRMIAITHIIPSILFFTYNTQYDLLQQLLNSCIKYSYCIFKWKTFMARITYHHRINLV